MVAQLARIKARVTWNTLTAQAWIAVLIILGILYGLGVILMAVLGAVASIAGGWANIVNALVILAGAALIIGWVMLPVIFAAQDNTLDPRRFAPFVGPSRSFALGLIVATVIGIGGSFSVLAALIPVVTWAAQGDVLAAALALLSAPLALAMAFTWSRTLTTWLGVRVTATSGRRDLTTILATMLFILILAPMGVWMQMIMNNFDPTIVERVAAFAAWTPFGAPWAIAASAHSGAWLAMLGQVAICLGTLAAGAWAWMRVLPAAMAGTAAPVSAQADQAMAKGRYLVDPEAEERNAHNDTKRWGIGGGRDEATQAGRQGATARAFVGVRHFQRMGLSAPAASLANRTLIYWIKDPRLLTSWLSSLIFPVMAIFWSRIPEMGGGFPLFFILFMPMLLGAVTGALMQYDSTALWLLVSSGIRGRDERLGRLAGSLPILVPITVVSTVGFCAASGMDMPSSILLITSTMAVLAGATSTTLIVAARWVYPVQPPGTSPLATKGTGQFVTTMILQFAQWLLTFVSAAPALIVLALAYLGMIPALVAVLVALVWSGGLFVAGVVVGGRMWDGSQVEVLTKIRAWPGH